MAARIIGRVFLTLGFLAASVGYSSWTAQRTILDPSATRGATQALISAPAVSTMLAREIRNSLAPAVGEAAKSPKLTKAIDAAVADPEFVGAFQDAIMSLHEGLLSGGGGRVTLDTHAVTRSIKHAVDRFDPAVAPKLRKLKSVRIPLGGSGLPHIGDVRPRVTRVRNIAIAIAILFIGGALALARNRKTFRRVGRRITFLAAGPALIFGVVPRIMESTHNRSLQVSAAILEAYSHRVLFSAWALAVVGLSTWIIAIALPKRSEQSPAETTAPVSSPAPVDPPDPRTPSFDPTAGLPEKLYL